MKKISGLAALVFFATPFIEAQTDTKEGIAWVYSLEKGKKEAKEGDKSLMLYFSTLGCGACKRMEKETFSDTNVVNLSKSFICVKENNKKYERDYKILFYPTVVFETNEGKELGRVIGYRNPTEFADYMKKWSE